MRISECAAIGRVKSPAGVDTSEKQRDQSQCSPGDIEIPAQQVDAWKRQIARADHQGNQEVAERGWYGWHQKKEDHRDAMKGEKLVIRFGFDERRMGGEQLQAHDYRGETTDGKEECD